MALISGFQPNCEVTDPKFLFRHNQPRQLLERLTTDLQLGTNVQLIGERRSGKTSVLKCLASQLKKDHPEFIPIYLNYREHSSIIGLGAAYKFLLASIHAAVVQARGTVRDDSGVTSIRGIEFPKDVFPETTFEALSAIPEYRIGGIIEEYLQVLSARGLSTILLIDEYEHLMRNTFGGNGGEFFLIRSLSSKPALKAHPKPLTYIIAGVLPWDQLCSLIGSPELNNTGPLLFTEPLDLPSFTAMWRHCLRISSPSFQEMVRKTGLGAGEIFQMVGGWAFYGKLAGQYLGSSLFNENELFDGLVQHFNIIWSHMNTHERELLISCENGTYVIDNPSERTLIQRGLLEKSQEGKTILRGTLWTNYVRGQKREASVHLHNSNQPDGINGRLSLMSDDIAVLVTEINETSINMGNGEIFCCSNQDVQTYLDLRRPGINKDEFSHFALSLYNLLFERTSKEKNNKAVSGDGKSIVQRQIFRPLETLPNEFRRNNITIRIVDAVRHHFGKGHLTRLDSFNSSGSGMDISEVLERYLYSKAHPLDHQFFELQLGILNDVIGYLTELRSYLQKEAISTAETGIMGESR